MASEAANRPQVLIAGGGVTGLEALLALADLARDRVEITLLSRDPEFTYRPLTVEEPFSLGPAERKALEPIAAEAGARFAQGALARVRPEEHAIELADGSSESFDMLIVCVGAKPRAVYERAITFGVGTELFRIDDLLGEAGGGSARIAFVVPPGVTWALPIYELALMTQSRAAEAGAKVDCTIVTPERAPLIIFGVPASDAVAVLLRARGIEVETSVHTHQSDAGDLIMTPGDRPLAADHVVTLPLLGGPRIEGLPVDDQGFIPIDAHARVPGADDVYAAGDGTTFPIKQGGIGTQQADAAAEHIAQRAGAALEARPFHPVLRGKLIAGDESMHLRHDLAGGTGEGIASDDYLWWPPHKISGRYLAPWLAREAPQTDPAPPEHSIDVEVALPSEWHSEPMALDPYGPVEVGD